MSKTLPFGTYVKLTLLAWLSMIGFDFFWHAGILARLYARPNPFLLPPERAFTFIPIGYLSFLGFAILLVWLMARIGIQGWRRGAIFGLGLEGLVWGSFVLGLFSISPASPALLLGWLVGQTIELSIAGMFAGIGFAGFRMSRLLLWVFTLVLACMILTVILQNVGWAPTFSR